MKRIIDFFGALIGLIVLSPVLLIVSIVVRVSMGGPIFFRQVRAGKDGKPFTMIKFRTMSNGRGAVQGEDDGDRITPLGKVLRETSIDELPELFNVLKGDISLVGPRPLFLEYIPLYSKEQRRRLDVRPGITGWAQVNGRNEINWEKKFQLDVWYVDNCSFWLDIRILLITLKKVFVKEGISAEGQATTEYFKGNIND